MSRACALTVSRKSAGLLRENFSGAKAAVMGFSAMEVFVPMLLVGLIATVIAAVAAKLLGKLPMYRLPRVVVTPIEN